MEYKQPFPRPKSVRDDASTMYYAIDLWLNGLKPVLAWLMDMALTGIMIPSQTRHMLQAGSCTTHQVATTKFSGAVSQQPPLSALNQVG